MESFPDEANSTDLQLWKEPQAIFPMVILSLTFLLGVPGNGLVLWVAGLKMKWTVNTVWFLHLTLADFLCCLSLPFSLVHIALQGHWPYGWFLCKLIPSIIILNMFASVFLLTTISLDRCLLVLKPIWCQNRRNVRTAFTVCGCIWVAAFAMCIPVFIYRDTFTVDNHIRCGYNYGDDNSYNDLDFIYDGPENGTLDNATLQLYSDTYYSFSYTTEPLQDDNKGHFEYDNFVSTPLVVITITRLVMGFLLPFIVMVACYSLIIFRVRRSRFTKSRSKTFRVTMVVVAVFLVCWAPYHIVGVLFLIIGPNNPFREALLSWDHVSIALASANSCFNPFLYALMGKDFRKKAKQSMQGILEVAFSEEHTHSTSCTPKKAFSERNSSSIAV
ncbi:C3a anaphylatoxin chemotactic receptor [Saccopteryx leptura]|uniref:C3a anaphylatoxin chemotactic receptor n=1 Tax=Saccopteryx leptura TaxID=249018 RepID=UPI00339CD6B4